MKARWETKRLGDVANFEKSKHDQSEAIYVGLEDITSDTLEFTGSFVPTGGKSSTFAFSPNHLLYGRLRPYLNKALLPDFAGHCSSEIFPILPAPQLNRSFLGYWITSEEIRDRINETCTGARMPRANMKEVLGFEIPLPPLEEQKRIVAVLDEAFAALDRARTHAETNLKNAHELFESFIESTFAAQSVANFTTLEECADVVSGYSFSSGDFASDNPVKSIKITNVGIREFVEADTARLPECFLTEYSRFSIPEGSIVVALTRSIIAGGLKVAIVPEAFSGALLNQRVAALKFSDEHALRDYLYLYLCSSSMIKYVQEKANTLMQPNLSIIDLKKLPLPMPEAMERERLVTAANQLSDEVSRLKTIYQSQAGDIADLRQSLLQKAFAGELT